MCFNVSFCAFFEDDKEDEAHDEEDDEEDEADDEDDEDEEGLSSGFALVGHAFHGVGMAPGGAPQAERMNWVMPAPRVFVGRRSKPNRS